MIELIDHVAITVDDVGATIAFYERVLGAEALLRDLFEAGSVPVVLLQLGGSRLSVHPAAAPAAPHAHRPTPGSVDLCFRWVGSIDSAVKQLEDAGVEIIEGPVDRPANDGRPARSVYFRDPDQNLIELLAVTG